ncbi:MAG: hypothetical protein RDU20_08910 [Desulfomonilaceae bacterium]|nr:hypothetical protein [Desulfomonilaceae bacterium]
MADKFEEKERFDGQKVKILVPEYAEGTDADRYQWRVNVNAVNVGEESNPVKRYLTTAERYFYSKDWFGSEKRKNPA